MFSLEDFARYSSRQRDYSRYGIICRSEEEANECCRWMDSVGKTWADGDSFLNDNYFYGELINYYDNGMYSAVNDTFNKYAEDYMEWSFLRKQLLRDDTVEPKLLSSDDIDTMLENIKIY